jgi:hypothetical protein
MRRWPSLFLFAGLLGLAAAAAGTPRVSVPEAILDLGTVRPGSVTAGQFVIRNTGDAPLRILDITAHCGCTVAELSDRVIPPGGRVPLAVTFTAGTKQEDVAKHIDVGTNDPVTPRVTLLIHARVAGDLDWEPRTVNLDWPVAPDYVGRIVFRAPAVAEPKRVYDETGLLRTEWRRLPGEGWEVLFRLPAGAGYSRTATVCVESDSRDFPLAKVPVYFQKPSLLRVTPSRASFWLRDGAAPPVRRLTITRKDGQPLKVLRAEPSRDYLLVRVVEAAGAAAVLEVTLRNGVAPGPCDANLHIVTDVEELWLNIPCKVVPRAESQKGP